MADISQRDVLRPIRFTSWNLRGLNGPIERTRVLSHLKNVKTDIAFLQETHLRVYDHTGLDRFSTPTSIGVREVQLLHKRVEFSSEQVVSDPNGRFIVVGGVPFQTPVIIMVCVDAPNWNCPNFMT